MLSILKTFGLGLLCTILSPLIFLVLILYFAYSLIVIVIMAIINIFKFFKGTSILEDLEEEKQAKKILKGQAEYEAKLRDAFLNNVNVNPFVAPEPSIPPQHVNGGEDHD